VPYVKDMMQRFSAQLAVVHAYGPEALAYSALPMNDPELPGEARGHEEQRLREFALETFPGEHVETFAELGEAGTVIHSIVQHQGADLVMLPTHGRGPIRRFLLGSVAAKVLHDVSAVVWTGRVSAIREHVLELPYKSILCAVDDSEDSEAVLKAAVAFAGAYQAQLSLVQVVETPAGTPEADVNPYYQQEIAAADFRLRELKAPLGVGVPHAVIDGAVADGVRLEAVRRKADLIITGRRHAQAKFSRIWSHLYQIVRESPCPVLSI